MMGVLGRASCDEVGPECGLPSARNGERICLVSCCSYGGGCVRVFYEPAPIRPCEKAIILVSPAKREVSRISHARFLSSFGATQAHCKS